MPVFRPIHDMLAGAAGRVSGHMPGHKGRAPFGAEDLYALDTTELPTTDNLYAPERGIAEAQRLYARAAGAAETLFLTGGATAGIAVMLQLWARRGLGGKPGDTVLLPRSAHHSAVDACARFGLHPEWIPVRQRENGKVYVAQEDVLAALAAHPEAKTLLLTRPDYDGACIPLEGIIAQAHARGIRVAVDEAHGAHLPWLEGLPSAGALGADAWVQSVHKTLPGLTGSAVLHLRDAADHPRALRLLRRSQSSSPSFLLLQSIDDARAWMELQGRERLRQVAEAADSLRRALPALGYSDAQARMAEPGYSFDPTRLVIEAPQGGFALEGELRARGIDAEMADFTSVTLIFTACSTAQDFAAVRAALETIRPHAEPLPPVPALTALPPRRVDPWETEAMDWEAVPVREAAGRVSAVAAGLYPPGMPLVMPGEIITEDTMRLLAQAPSQGRFGLEEDRWLCVQDAP